MNSVGFGYGVLCDDLEKQANAQGYTLGDKVKTLEKLRFSLNMVRMHNLLTDSQADKAYEKLNKKVVNELKRLPAAPEETKGETENG